MRVYHSTASTDHDPQSFFRRGKTIAHPESAERYRVLQVSGDRVLLFIEGENRRNEYGGPVTWWAVFDNRNRFRWRRDDWPDNTMTALEWRRCL